LHIDSRIHFRVDVFLHPYVCSWPLSRPSIGLTASSLASSASFTLPAPHPPPPPLHPSSAFQLFGSINSRGGSP